MPYVDQASREELMKGPPQNAGELNYTFTKTIVEYLGEKPNYQKFNDVFGALIGALLELYRRKAAPYEDIKVLLNGDVY